MKRIIIIIIAIILGNNASAQAPIQTKFWGVEFSKHYDSIYDARKIINDQCELSFVISDMITVVGGKFGGRIWPLAKFEFGNINGKYLLCNVSFIKNFNNLPDAEQEQDELTEALKSKYGGYKTTELGTYLRPRVWATHDKRNACILIIHPKIGDEGEKLWMNYSGTG